MSDVLVNAYPWVKAFHIISVITWMAGLLYLPRLYVYHANNAEKDSIISQTLKTMERRLLRIIMNPAMVMTWVLGITLLVTPDILDWSSDFWIYVKLAMVLAMTWYHHWLGKRRKEFLADRNTRSAKSYRMMNEVPTVLMVVIVIMVVVKPF